MITFQSQPRLKTKVTGKETIDFGLATVLGIFSFDTQHILVNISRQDMIRSTALSHMCRNPFKSSSELESVVLPWT